MIGQGAYLYQYSKYGMEQEKLVECLAVMEQIQLSYNQLK